MRDHARPAAARAAGVAPPIGTPLVAFSVLSQSLFLMNLESCRSLNLWSQFFDFARKTQLCDRTIYSLRKRWGEVCETHTSPRRDCRWPRLLLFDILSYRNCRCSPQRADVSAMNVAKAGVVIIVGRQIQQLLRQARTVGTSQR